MTKKSLTKTKKSLMLLMAFSIISKILGLLREMVLASKYGAGVISDSYIVSLSIQNVLFASLSSAILINYIPIFSKITDEEKRKKFNGDLIGILLVLISIVITIFLTFNKDILKLFVAGFSNDSINILSKMVSITIFSSYFLIIGYVLKGYLEYKENFICSAINGVLLNVGLIGGILLSSSDKLNILSFGVLVGYGLNFIIMLIFAIKNGFRYKASLNIKNEHVKKLVLLTIPLILNDAVWEINSIVDKSITSKIGSGYISALNYGNFIVTVFITVFIKSVSTIIFPKLVKNIDDNNYIQIQLKRIVKYLIIVCIPVTYLMIIYSNDIIKVIFFRGNFSMESVNITAIALKLYSLGIIFSSYKSVMFNLFYARQETKIPSICATISIIINIILSLVFVNIWSYIGVIIATVISSFVSSLLLYLFYRKKYESIFTKELFMELFRIIIINIVIIILICGFKYFIELVNMNYYLYLFVNVIFVGLMTVLYMLILKKSKIEFL